MRKPRITSKRVLGATLAAALVVTGAVALAGNSSAATVPAMTITPVSGSATGGDTITIKGKGLTDDDGSSVVLAARFDTAACADGTPAGTDILSGLTVVSATKAVLVIPGSQSWTAGNAYLCLFDGTGSTAKVVGSAKYAVGDAPAVTTVNTLSSGAISSSTFGGTALTFVGTDFTKKTYVTVDGTKATTKFVDDTKITATVPAGTAGTAKVIKVVSEYGSATATPTVTYQSVGKVAPAYGKASTAVGIELTGKGFNALDFVGTAAGDAAIAFIPAGATLTAGTTTIASLATCTNIVVENDTTLSCKTPASLSGPYSVLIVTRHATTATTYGASYTVVSRSATYTAANF